jgi:O-antigen/teichoic acid export membrane protein
LKLNPPTILEKHLNTSPPQNQISQVTKWFSGSLFINIFSAGISFVTNLLLANFLGKQEFGIFTYATSWRALLAIPSTLGIDRLIIRENSVYQSKGEWRLAKGLLNFANLLTLFVSSLLALIVFIIVSSTHRDNVLLQTTFLLTICTLPMQSLRTIRVSMMQGFNKIILALLPDSVIFPSLFLLLILISRFLINPSLTSAFVAKLDVIAISASFLIGIYLFRVSTSTEFKNAPSSYQVWSWLQNTLPFTLYYVVFSINTKADVLMLGWLKSTDEVGLYSIASRAPEILSFSLLAVNRSIGPTIASLYSQEKVEELQKVVDKANKISLLFTLPLALLLILFSGNFLSLFGKDFVEANAAMVILIVSQLVNVCTGPTAILLSMTYNQNQATILLLFSSCLNLFLNFLLIPKIGITGAAISALSSSLLNNVSSSIFIRKQTGILSYLHF